MLLYENAFSPCAREGVLLTMAIFPAALPAIVPGSADPALGDNGSRQGLLMSKLAVNAAGKIAIVNSTLKSGERSHIWLFRSHHPAAHD